MYLDLIIKYKIREHLACNFFMAGVVDSRLILTTSVQCRHRVNSCFPLAATMLFIHHNDNLSQYPNGDCLTHREKCKISKLFCGETWE